MAVQKKKILATLCIVHDDEKILLGKKKKGLGIGKWNSFGGRVEENETIEDAAHRELYEEADIRPKKLDKCAVLTLIGEAVCDMEIHVFKAIGFTGTPKESDEMSPQWFNHADMPYEDMWSSDIHWLPKILNGQKLKGNFVLENDEVASHQIEVFATLD